ncbi:alpha/beta-hydrolase [Lenzites betulinus]|nr:alpha/beta-hydrolase [Lenzites betulinus]
MVFSTSTISQLFPSGQAKEGLHLVAKCYTPENSKTENGITLILLHCAGSHKESWEPSLEHLFAKTAADGSPIIREAWSFEMQSHGEAAIKNEAALNGIGAPLTVEEYADGVKRYIATGALSGHRLVGIGHSNGVTALLLTSMSDALPGVKYESMVLIEPPLVTREVFDANLEEREGALRYLSTSIAKRRDTWESREDALKYFGKRFPWMAWHPKVLELYVRYGLREVPVPGSDPAQTQVTLCCTKTQEQDTYVHVKPHFDVVPTIRDIPAAYPLHFVFGERNDLIQEYVQQSILDLRQAPSVRRIPGSGHFVLQENPEGLAETIGEILTGMVQLKANL